MQDTCKIHRIRILITNPPKFDNKPPVTRGGAGTTHTGHTRDTRAHKGTRINTGKKTPGEAGTHTELRYRVLYRVLI